MRQVCKMTLIKRHYRTYIQSASLLWLYVAALVYRNTSSCVTCPNAFVTVSAHSPFCISKMWQNHRSWWIIWCIEFSFEYSVIVWVKSEHLHLHSYIIYQQCIRILYSAFYEQPLLELNNWLIVSTVIASWTAGQQVKWAILHQGHDSYQNSSH